MSGLEIGYLGWEDRILKLVLERGKLRQLLFVETSRAEETPGPNLALALCQLRDYLAGRSRGFALKTDPDGTPFQKEVWKALLDIPYGETRSYKQIAQSIGRPHAFRAVGQAANRNPLPIVIPCHRLVGSNGSLTGYAGGLALKQRLLLLEQNVLESG